jgi:hypothetical protein
VDQLPTVVADEEEDVKRPKPDGVHDQEIRRPDPLELVGEERPPGLTAAGRGFSASDSAGSIVCSPRSRA